MPLNKIRESINLFLYETRERSLSVGRILHIIVSFAAILILGYYYGFPHAEEEKESLLYLIRLSFIFYILWFGVRLLYSYNIWNFLRKNWLESLVILLLIAEGIRFTFTGTVLLEQTARNLGIQDYEDVSNVLVQLYFFITILLSTGKSGNLFSRIKVHPAVIFISSFLLLIGLGTILLLLPEMTENGISLVDAFFTSTSATCVTGLMVENALEFTYRGQLIILVLIKLGGLNIIAFGYFMTFAGKLGLSVKQHDVIEDFVNKDYALSARNMLGKVVRWSIIIELIGAALMFVVWGDSISGGLGDRIYQSIFLSVSAFNNAGISLFTDGLATVETLADGTQVAVGANYLIHLIVTFLVFFGALGMVAIFDLFDPKNLRDRAQNSWKTISFSTKIALYFSIGLVFVGTLAYYFLEQNDTLKDLSLIEKLITSLFQSVTRTSGFNTVDIGSMSFAMLFLMIILMFIGSSSSSTGGGIKTSTLAVIWADVSATVRGLNHASLFKHTIPLTLKSRAYSVLVIFILGNLLGIFILSISEVEILKTHERGMLALAFEQVSAMGTVGLSMGITAQLTTVGKIVICLSMFVGRVGTLTVAFALGRKLISKNFKYAEGHTMIG